MLEQAVIKVLSLRSFATTVAEEMLNDVLEGGYGRVPCLRHASLIYNVDEGEIYKEIKKAQSKLQDPLTLVGL